MRILGFLRDLAFSEGFLRDMGKFRRDLGISERFRGDLGDFQQGFQGREIFGVSDRLGGFPGGILGFSHGILRGIFGFSEGFGVSQGISGGSGAFPAGISGSFQRDLRHFQEALWGF